MYNGMYQDFSVKEFVDMFPRTNGNILVHTILDGIGSEDRYQSEPMTSHVETVCLMSRGDAAL